MEGFFNSLNTFGKGSWLYFPPKEQKLEQFSDNCKIIAEMFKDTQVCLKDIKYVQKYLAIDPFFVFVDNLGNPQIVGNTSVGTIDYLRGVCDGYEQTIDSEYMDVANEFLDKCSKFYYKTNVWKYQINWHDRLRSYLTLFKEKKYQLINVQQLIDDLAYNGYSLHFPNCLTSDSIYYPAVKREILQEPMLKPMIAKHLGCRTDEIYIGKYYGNGKNKKYIIGHLLSDFLHEKCAIEKVFGYVKIQNYHGNFKRLDKIDSTISYHIDGWAGCDLIFEDLFKNVKEVTSKSDYESMERTI